MRLFPFATMTLANVSLTTICMAAFLGQTYAESVEDLIADSGITGRSGIEVVGLEEGCIGNNSWIRGTCQYGIMPANGLLYALPHACVCFAKVKLTGLYAVAGRNSYLDGGMVLYRLDPLIGEELSRTPIYDLDPETDIQTGGERKFDMQGVETDIISGDGECVYVKHQGFTRDGQPTGGSKPHLMSAVAGVQGKEAGNHG